MPDPVVIEFVADTTGLQPVVDKIQSLGDIDANSAAVFKATNEQIKQRNQLLSDSLKDSQGLSLTVTEQQAAYNKLANSVKDLFGASKNAATELLKLGSSTLLQGLKEKGVTVDQLILSLKGLQVGTQDTIGQTTKAGEAFDQFGEKVAATGAAVDDTVNHTTRLRTQLLEVTNDLAKLGPLTNENAAEFARLSARAGELGNELQQTRGLVRNLSSESPVLNAFSESVTGLAGAFQAGVGAAALFGDQNKDLQETLVKVTSVTAIAQGVQSALNLVNKSGAFTTLSLALANKENAIQTQLATAAESENAIVAGVATVAQKLLNAAFAANPVGLFFTALVAVIGVLLEYTSNVRKAEEAQKELNQAIQDSTDISEANLATTKRQTAEQVSALEALNSKQSEILRAQAVEQQKTSQNIEQYIAEQNAFVFANSESRDEKIQELVKKAQENADKAQGQLLQSNTDFYNKLRELDKQRSVEALQAQIDLSNAQVELARKNSDALFAAQRVNLAAQTALELKNAGDDEEKITDIRAAAHRKLLDINAAEDAQHAADRVSLETATLTKIQTESRRINTGITAEETAAQIKILQERADDEIRLEGTTAAKRLEIQAVLQQNIEQLNRDQQIRDLTLANTQAIARNNVVLAGIQATNRERLTLEVENEQDLTQIALLATNLTEEQRRAIIAQSNEKIRQLNNEFIKQQAEDNIAQTEANNAAGLSELERQLAAQAEIRAAGSRKGVVAQQLGVPELNIQDQLKGIDTITQAALDSNNKRIDANFALQQSDEDFAKAEVQLEANGLAIQAAGEERKRKLVKDTADFQRAQTIATIQAVSQNATAIIGFLNQVFQAQDQAEQQRLDAKKQRIQDELDAGNITQKEADKRNKEADAEAKKLQVEQAKRAKEIALFTAIVNTATAIAVALTGGPIIGIINAAISAAIGAAQIALIASTPLPSFKKGKNNKSSMDRYEGWANIGEAGPELWQSGSQMKLAEKSSIVWLKKDDKVYDASQTASMMNTKIPIAGKVREQEFNYEKLATAVSKKSAIVLNIDGYKTFIQEEKSFTEILDNRRKWVKDK